ncbi:hypothetical protein DRN73_05795 [Candidatus Pacearchaeota archaeon]|nr:MAG: hypothetical protein DRN73_05795 [Candidatus Pacearchaeota archaeon]
MLDNIISLWNNREALRILFSNYPVLAPFLFILLQALQVVVAPIPGEGTGFIGGFFFGAFKGFILSTTGIFIGSFISFNISRFFKKRFFKKYKNHKLYLKTTSVFKKYGLIGVFILYIFPGFPKDLLNYFLGLTPISLKAFLWVSTLGRIPGNIALALQGDVVYSGSSKKIIIIFCVFLITFLIFWIIQKRFNKWLEDEITT